MRRSDLLSCGLEKHCLFLVAEVAAAGVVDEEEVQLDLACA